MPDDRYIRQTRVAGFGSEGQTRLAEACVAIVGLGALGSRVAEDLGRSGVGKLRLIDRDWIELSNLHRQHLYDERDAANEEPKALASAARLAAINSEIELEPELRDLGPENCDELLADVDLVVDGTDNFQTRYVLNDYCVREGKPWIYGACVASQAMAAAFLPGRACLRCIFPEAPPASSTQTCETAGILPSAAAQATAWQSMLALRTLARPDDPPKPALLSADVLSGESRSMQLPETPSSSCTSCNDRRFEALDADRASHSKVLCGRDAVQLSASTQTFPPLEDLARRLDGLEFELRPQLLRINAPEGRITVFRSGRAIVQGTQDEGRARALFDRYIGS